MTGSDGMRRSIWTFKRGAPLLFLVALVVQITPARAQVGSERWASVVIDARTGDLLSAAQADEPRYPASLTKMMTIYMLFEALRDRRVSLGQLVPVSHHAASMMPSKLGLLPTTQITVEQALLGLVTKSANDAASALGELMAGGDEDRFAQMMTMRARALGMSHTTFRNASGLPDPDQITTARDLSVLARHLIQDYPVEYRYFSTPSFVFHGRLIPNHDRMLQTYPGADGLKTGYTDASGCNLVTSAVRGDVRLIGVIMGAVNGVERDSNMAAQLDAGFERLGVPVVPMEMPRTRYPALVAAASQATLPPSSIAPPRHAGRYAESRGGRFHPVREEIRIRPARDDVRMRPGRSELPVPPRDEVRIRTTRVEMAAPAARGEPHGRHLAEPVARMRSHPEPVAARPTPHSGGHATSSASLNGGRSRG
jgi:D-alanyl-D-alanine carboxypeptidase